jgi:nitrogen fixation protein NifM
MPETIDSGVAYLALKTAHKLYGKGTDNLAPAEFERVQKVARKQHELEALVLVAPEARDVMIPDATLEEALEEIRARYKDREDFLDELEHNGLDQSSLAEALERELKVEAVLEKVSTRAAHVTDIDVELYYHYHPDQFRRPESRLARHILITINDQYPDNTRAKARERIEAVAARVRKDPTRFEEQALKHSECPTALQGGVLGDVPRGTLFPQLDEALFTMNAGDVSGILESELGFHILRCDSITAASILSFGDARRHIRNLLEDKRKAICQKAWVRQLLI